MDRISESCGIIRRISHKNIEYVHKVKQMLTRVFIRPFHYLCLILSGCTCWISVLICGAGCRTGRCVLLWLWWQECILTQSDTGLPSVNDAAASGSHYCRKALSGETADGAQNRVSFQRVPMAASAITWKTVAELRHNGVAGIRFHIR